MSRPTASASALAMAVLGCLLTLPSSSKAAATPQLTVEEAVQIISESDDEGKALQALRPYGNATEAAVVPLLQHLRQHMIEHTSARYRERARRGLIALLLARQEQKPITNINKFTNSNIAAAYQLASAGRTGADAALALLAGPGASKEAALRLVAANSLGLTGIVPSDDIAAKLDQVIDVEADREAQAEQLQTMAVFATSAPAAYQRLAKRLLLLKDCNLVQRTAMTLPAADLRLWIFKRLPGKDGSRGAQVRRWVKAKIYQSCSE